MTILDQLINLMLKKVEVTPVPKQELDNFLSQNNIDICDENHQFLLKYGNSGFLRQGYAYLDFEEFQDYYLEVEFIEDIKLHMVTAILEWILMMNYYVKNFKKVNYIFLVAGKNMKLLTMAD